MAEARAAARAIDALRRGESVRVDNRFDILAVETADADSLATFDADAPAHLLISFARAAVLHLANQRAAAATPGAGVAIVRSGRATLAHAQAIADPVFDLATPLKGPFRTRSLGEDAPAAATALRLARHAGLLPALFIRPADVAAPSLAVTTSEVDAYDAPATVRLVTRARLPIDVMENCEVVAFRGAGGPEHLALVLGDPPRDRPVLTRLHSACLTGDLLGSLKCDCGPQLRAALATLAAERSGVLLYLQQEGRGIGLINKLRAYSLQDQGFDTVDANLRLGFAVDERDFGLAASMLRQLGFAAVRLMTNNPEKVAQLEAAGINVAQRVPHQLPDNPHNTRYLAVKRDRTGHYL